MKDPDVFSNAFRIYRDVGYQIDIHVNGDRGIDMVIDNLTMSGLAAGENQRISSEGAIRTATLDAAYTLKLKNKAGNIVPGKPANFSILGDNPDYLSLRNFRPCTMGVHYSGHVEKILGELSAHHENMPTQRFRQMDSAPKVEITA